MQYEIPTGNVDSLKTKIEKINRRATKLGCPNITLTTGKVYFQEKDEKKISYTTVEITGEAPKVGGWEFIAAIDHDEHNFVRVLPGHSLPVKYRSANANCEHCNINRRRNNTFILLKDGEHKQVGRNCLADFLGGHDPHRAASIAEYLLDVFDLAKEHEDIDYTKGGTYGWSLDRVLSRTYQVIKKEGWVSKKQADEDQGITPTATIVVSSLCDPKTARLFADVEVDENIVNQAKEWALSLSTKPNSSDYEYNVGVLAMSDYVNQKRMGIAVSILGVFLKNLADKQKNNSEYQGTVKETFCRRLEVVGVSFIRSQFGATTLYKLVDANGNRFAWFASSGELKLNDRVFLSGTVKSHNEYKGVKETNLSHCSVVTLSERVAQLAAKPKKWLAAKVGSPDKKTKEELAQEIAEQEFNILFADDGSFVEVDGNYKVHSPCCAVLNKALTGIIP